MAALNPREWKAWCALRDVIESIRWGLALEADGKPYGVEDDDV